MMRRFQTSGLRPPRRSEGCISEVPRYQFILFSLQGQAEENHFKSENLSLLARGELAGHQTDAKTKISVRHQRGLCALSHPS